MIENLEKGAPVVFGIPGHAVVLDGYDKATDMFHLNYGWGPDDAESESVPAEKASTKWYTRDEFKALQTIGMVLDISPVYQETFTVTDSRILGTGTLVRVIQQATAMQGANIITFDETLAGSGALEMPYSLELKDKITFDGFNMTLFSPKQHEAEKGNNAQQDNEVAVSFFFGDDGNRTDFTDFRGNIICKYQEND